METSAEAAFAYAIGLTPFEIFIAMRAAGGSVGARFERSGMRAR